MICVCESTATDFSNNGPGAITPQSCTVTETPSGEWELTPVHPIDENGKWLRIQRREGWRKKDRWTNRRNVSSKYSARKKEVVKYSRIVV